MKRRLHALSGTVIQMILLLSCLVLAPPSAAAAEVDAPPAESPPDLTKMTLADLLQMEVPIVESASKFKQKAKDAPSAVSVINADDIKKYGYRTLGEVLQSARGLHMSYDRNYAFLGLRGFNRGDYNSRVLVLIDGHRINNNLTDGAPIGTDFPLDIDLIEQVEIIRGPSAVLYGNNAFFGVINVVTRKGRDQPGYGAEVSGEYAEFDTYKGRVTYGHKFKNALELFLSGSYYDSAGDDRLFFREFNSPPTNNGIAENGDDDQFKSFFGTMTYRDFSLQGAIITREKHNPTAPYGTAFNDPRFATVDDRSYINLSYNHEFPDIVEVNAKVYYDRYDLTRDQPIDPTLPLNKEEQTGEWWGAELQLNKTLWEKLRLSLGAEYRDDFRQERQNFSADQPGVILGENHRTAQNHGVFVNGDYAILTNLHLNAGARYDQYQDVDPTANPRVALIYNPGPSSTLKAIYGTAFRAPNFFERNLESSAGTLVPETITTYELLFQQDIGQHFRATIDGYYNEIDDLISFQPDALGGFSYQNIRGAISQGLEFELETFWTNGFRARLSYARQDVEDRSTHQALSDSPEHLVKLNLTAPVLPDKLFASLEVLYSSQRLVLTPPGRPIVSPQADAFGVVNFTLFSHNLVKGLDLSAGVYNLFDEKYSDPATPGHLQDLIAQNGRTFRVKLTYRF